MNYRFYITHNSQPPVEVFPLKFKDATIVSEKEQDQIFFRRKFNGSLVFMNNNGGPDFTYLKGILDGADRCLELSLDIQRQCGTEEFESWWQGYFNVNDGDWNLDRCSVSFDDIKTDDEYRCVVENGEREVNILSSDAVFETRTTFLTDYEWYTCRDTDGACSGSLPAGGGWLLFHTEQIDGDWTSIYYRERTITACLASVPQAPPGGWTLLSNDCAISGYSSYVRTPIVVYPNNPNPNVAAGDCATGIPGSYIPTFPPRAKRLDVDLTNTPVTPEIIGYDRAVASISGYSEEYTFSVRNNPGSTYLWSGVDFTIISGQGTNTIVVEFTNSTNVTIEVTETTICSTATMVTKVIDVVSPGELTGCNINHDPTGVLRVCKNQEGVVYTMPVLPELYDDPIVWSVSAGATIMSGQGTNEVVIDFGDGSSGDVTVSFSATNTTITFTSAISGNIDVAISNAAITPDIEGLDSLCPASTGIVYEIQDRLSATYTWSITNGTIVSGQGTNSVVVDWDNIVGTGEIEVKEDINCGCNYLLITECGASGEPPFYWCTPDDDVVEYNYNRSLEGIMQLFQLQCDMNACLSDFFEINPPGDTPGYVAGINYITGLENKLKYLLMAQKSDIINPIATQPATIGMLSFNELMTMLREMFQVYWFIESNSIRLEHVNWFTRAPNPDFDLTSPTLSKYIDGKNKFAFDKPKMPKYERYKWMEAQGPDFIGAEISYDSSCVNQDPKQNILNHLPGEVTTDLPFINAEPDEIDKEGFVFIANVNNGMFLVVDQEEGIISGLTKPNMHLSWANLHYNYHRYERVLLEGNMNNQLETFLSAKKTKRQVKISFPYCCDNTLNPLIDLVTTGLGEGEIDNMEHSIRNNTMTAELLYDI